MSHRRTLSFFVPSKQRSSPYINHFIQPDTIIPDPTSPQAWNRYSYVGNRPVNANDPSGHKACGDGEEYDCSTGKKNKDNVRVIFVPEDGTSGSNSAPEVENNLEEMANTIRDDPYLKNENFLLSSSITGIPGYYLGLHLCPTTGPVAPVACAVMVGMILSKIGSEIFDDPYSEFQYMDATKLDEVRHALNNAQLDSHENVMVSMVTYPAPRSMATVDETGYMSLDPNYHDTFSYLYIDEQSPIRLTVDQAILVDNAFGGGLIP